MSFKMLPQATINLRQGTENLVQLWRFGSLEIPLDFDIETVHPKFTKACNFHHIMTDMNHFSRSGDVLPTRWNQAIGPENPRQPILCNVPKKISIRHAWFYTRCEELWLINVSSRYFQITSFIMEK